MRRLLLSLLVFAFTLPALAQAKHPFTFEDMMKLKRVGDPQVSPDGKWVIFSVVDVDLDANTKTPHIWIVPTAGGQEREIITDQDADRPRWAPDGKHFAFLSTKEGGSQVWIAEFNYLDGTVIGVHKLTSIATEASGELWSPDGKNILFTSDVYPECDGPAAQEQECNARKVKDADQSKVKAQTFTHLFYRHWNAYKEGKRSHIFVISRFMEPIVHDPNAPPVDTLPRDLTPGDYDAPVFSLGGQDDYAFSPDGQEICYASNHDKNPAASTNNDLWIVPVNVGNDHVGTAASAVQVLAQTKNITADNPASDTSPLYSPDGRYIAYRAQQRPGYESDRFRLMLYDRKTGEKRNLTEDWPGWIESMVWRPDSKYIFTTGSDSGRTAIYTVRLVMSGNHEVQGTAPLAVIGEATNDSMVFTPDGKSVLFSRNSLKSPPDIYRARADVMLVTMTKEERDQLYAMEPFVLGEAKQLTHFNDAVLSQVDMSPLESFWFTGAYNDKVEGFLVKPPNFDASKKYPVKFLIHGGPQGAWGDDWSYRWNPELFASPTSSASSGYVAIMINFHGSTGYGQKFIDAINGDWGGAPFEDLMKGLDYAEQTYPFIDKNRECALGASYGGYMINWILGHTDRFKCLVSHDGMFNAESAWGTTEELWFNDWEFKGTPYDNRASYVKWSPHQYAKNFKTPTLVIHGQRDYRLDVSEGFQLFTTLQMEGVPSKMLYFPDEGHWVLKPQNSRLWYQTVNDWVDRWTKK
ncbi:MAG TPA: S9 family peptidase [Candidatus Sulfotelmatobacter sp.]|nr:S9 family peptidase [Candidatus Sulfotelmatobacter sp.]